MFDQKNHVDDIRKQLHIVHDRQMENKQALNNQAIVEQNLSEVNIESRRLFARLLHIWHQDEELGMQLEQCQIEINRHVQKISFELEERRQELLREKRKLFVLEDELSERIYSLNQEEEA